MTSTHFISTGSPESDAALKAELEAHGHTVVTYRELMDRERDDHLQDHPHTD